MLRVDILLTEDDDEDAELALAALETAGLRAKVARAKDGADALEFLRAQGRHADRAAEPAPRVVLLDLKLPRLNGFDVLTERRREPALMRVPFVVLTSSADARDVRRCYELGANSYVVKPVPFEEFSRTLTQVASYWLEINVCQREQAGDKAKGAR